MAARGRPAAAARTLTLTLTLSLTLTMPSSLAGTRGTRRMLGCGRDQEGRCLHRRVERLRHPPNAGAPPFGRRGLSRHARAQQEAVSRGGQLLSQQRLQRLQRRRRRRQRRRRAGPSAGRGGALAAAGKLAGTRPNRGATRRHIVAGRLHEGCSRRLQEGVHGSAVERERSHVLVESTQSLQRLFARWQRLR